MAAVNDIVLIFMEDQPASFARVESILPDSKKDWYHIKLLMLQVPLQVVTWILKDRYVNGEEFTMNGKRMRLEKVQTPMDEQPFTAPVPPNAPATDEGNTTDSDNLIRFSDFKKDS